MFIDILAYIITALIFAAAIALIVVVILLITRKKRLQKREQREQRRAERQAEAERIAEEKRRQAEWDALPEEEKQRIIEEREAKKREKLEAYEEKYGWRRCAYCTQWKRKKDEYDMAICWCKWNLEEIELSDKPYECDGWDYSAELKAKYKDKYGED